MINPKIFGSWYSVLSIFIESKHYKEIGEKLKELGTFFPESKYIFRSFQECSFPKECHTVILATHPVLEGNDGILFSSGFTKFNDDLPNLTKEFLSGMENDVSSGLYLKRKFNFGYLAKQGILLLPLNLTNSKGKLKEHLEIWSPFIDFVMGNLGKSSGRSFWLIGDKAQEYKKSIKEDRNSIYETEHPLTALKEKRPWRHKNTFSDISRGVKFLQDKEIIWT